MQPQSNDLIKQRLPLFTDIVNAWSQFAEQSSESYVMQLTQRKTIFLKFDDEDIYPWYFIEGTLVNLIDIDKSNLTFKIQVIGYEFLDDREIFDVTPIELAFVDQGKVFRTRQQVIESIIEKEKQSYKKFKKNDLIDMLCGYRYQEYNKTNFDKGTLTGLRFEELIIINEELVGN